MPVFQVTASSAAPLAAVDEMHARDLLRRRGESPDLPLTRVDNGGVDVVRRADELRELVRELRRRGRSTGLVPTMGALHDGHLSLVAASRRECDVTVVTIFVNPTQFGPDEDFDRYPRTFEEDLRRLRSAGADVCFAPPVEEMYPPGSSTAVQPPDVSRRWEGSCRPGHFQGVATIVLKLLHVAPTDVAFFGSKDYQQALVIRQLAADLLTPTEIRDCPIIREPDGLAMSSRNRYLSAAERQVALAVPGCLQAAAELVGRGERDPAAVARRMRDILEAGGVDKIDYAEVVDAATLEPLESIESGSVAIVAAHVGATRLIDNRRLA